MYQQIAVFLIICKSNQHERQKRDLCSENDEAKVTTMEFEFYNIGFFFYLLLLLLFRCRRDVDHFCVRRVLTAGNVDCRQRQWS